MNPRGRIFAAPARRVGIWNQRRVWFPWLRLYSVQVWGGEWWVHIYWEREG